MIPMALTGGTTTITSADMTPVLDALKTQISVGTIIEVVAVVTGACVGLAFMWWGVRFLTAKLMKAFKSGRV